MKVSMTMAQVAALMRQNLKGTTAISVDLDSDMDGKGKMRLTGNHFAGMGIVKRETLTGIIGYDYGAAVNRLAAKEGADERDAKQHPWGDMDDMRLFRVHRKTGDLYLSMKVQNVVVHGFFTPDGTEVVAEDIRKYIPVKVKSSTQADLEGEVIARDYALRNIRAVRAFGMDISILPDGEGASDSLTATTSEVAAPATAPATAPAVPA